jgi:hypothetical protein
VQNDGLEQSWAELIGILAAGWTGAFAYAAVTHLPRVRSTLVG